MSDEQILEDPTNRVVSVFDDQADARRAREEFIQLGLSDEQVRVFDGKDTAAEKVDTSHKWFADTDEDIRRYQEELKLGNTVLSVPVADSKSREKIHTILKRHHGRLITHFGQWVTELMQ